MLNVAQTIAVIFATLVSAFAVVRAETNRRRSLQRARIEQLLAAVVALAEAVILAQEKQGRGAEVEVARMRLRAALAIADDDDLAATDILARQSKLEDIKNQSEAAVLELAKAIDRVA